MMSKILICCDCLEKEVRIDPNTEQFIFPNCVQRRLVLLKRFAGAIFKEAFYETEREKRAELQENSSSQEKIETKKDLFIENEGR